MPTFKVQGHIYHLIGSLQSLPNEQPKFLQGYFMGDSLKQGTHRCSNIPGIQMDIDTPLQQMFNSNNAQIQCFKTALDGMPQDSNKYRVVNRTDNRLEKCDKQRLKPHQRRCVLLISGRVAVKILLQSTIGL